MPQGRRDKARWPWVATAVLAAAWLGLGFVPGLPSSWMWLGRAAIFFIGAAVLWFGYDPAEPDEGV
jgi:hypothetical protein